MKTNQTDTSTRQRAGAQCCASCVRRVVHVIVHIGLKLLKVCLSVATLFRSHICSLFVREFRVQDIFPLHPPSVNVDCRQRLPIS